MRPAWSRISEHARSPMPRCGNDTLLAEALRGNKSSMTVRMRRSLEDFRASKPGRRFRERYERRHREQRSRLSPSSILYIVVGVLLVIASVFLGPAPGFGFGTGFIGLALLASEFKFLARLLDKSEVKLRSLGRELRDIWRTLPFGLQAVLVLVAVILLLALAYGVYVLVFGPLLAAW